MLDVSNYSEDIDDIIFKDNEHIILTSYYPNGLVREFFCISERDTVALCFTEEGMPQLFTNGEEHIVFGTFSNYSAFAIRLEPDGSCTPMDLEVNIDWKEYKEIVSTVDTKGPSRKDNLKRHAQGQVFDMVFNKLAQLPYSPFSYGLWIGEALAYMVSGNPYYQETISYVFDSVDNGIMIYSYARAAAVSATVIETILASGLLIANYYVWKNVYEKVIYGIENDMFGLPWAQKYEAVERIIYGGVWLSSNGGTFPWVECSGIVSLKIGLATFDLTSLDWGVKSKPDWVKVDVVKGDQDNYFKYTIEHNDGDYRPGKIVIYVAGVRNVDYDLEFSVNQNRKIELSTTYINFEDNSPYDLDVYSWSEETWTIAHAPKWVDYSASGHLLDMNRRITITPKEELIETEYHNKNDNNLFILTVNKRGGGTYNAYVSLFYKEKNLCPNSNHPHMIDLGGGTRWCCCNLGASSPDQLADDFEIDNKEIIHAPSDSEFSWLWNHCSVRRVTMNGVNGVRCKSIINGNSIFLPDGSYYTSTYSYTYSQPDPYGFIIGPSGINGLYTIGCGKSAIRPVEH